VRAMSKYVPVDLVRRLYHEGREPVLGAVSEELSVLFTDIRDFTSFAERTTPDDVARLLGLYLQAMAMVIQAQKGTIDKYIGDAVMAFWNAPESVADHETLACRAALRCQDALRALFTSASWGEAPRFETRFGLHQCTASVGHFGAPDRFNYTAIGDGINLASRLEGLNKYYGTTVIASESIHSAVKDNFHFRRLDRVAVKGKTEGLLIYELLSEKIPEGRPSTAVFSYERAFDLYQNRDFKAALDLLEPHAEDAPSLALARRCRDLIANPPSNAWNGIHVFDSK
jgi:adenylate cyclase